MVDYSYTLKIASAESDYALLVAEQKRTDRLPSLTLSGDFTEQMRRSVGQESWSFNLQPQISETIYAGGSVRAQISKADDEARVALLDAKQDLLDVCYSADYAFYNLEAQRSYCSAVDEYISIIRSLKEVVDLRFEEGYIAKGDVLMIETRLSEAEYELIAIEQSYTIALQKFNILRGHSADVDVEQIPSSWRNYPMPQRVDLTELLQLRPDYLASRINADIYATNIDIARASYNPQISVGVAGVWSPNTPNINGSTQMNGSLFVKLSAPIFHFGERRKAVGAARAYYDRTLLVADKLVDTIIEEESNMWATITDSYAQMLSAQRSLEIASENLEISTYSYSEGLTTILDVMQAQISWLQLYSNAIASEFSYAVSLSAYRRITANDN